MPTCFISSVLLHPDLPCRNCLYSSRLCLISISPILPFHLNPPFTLTYLISTSSFTLTWLHLELPLTVLALWRPGSTQPRRNPAGAAGAGAGAPAGGTGGGSAVAGGCSAACGGAEAVDVSLSLSSSSSLHSLPLQLQSARRPWPAEVGGWSRRGASRRLGAPSRGRDCRYRPRRRQSRSDRCVAAGPGRRGIRTRGAWRPGGRAGRRGGRLRSRLGGLMRKTRRRGRRSWRGRGAWLGRGVCGG